MLSNSTCLAMLRISLAITVVHFTISHSRWRFSVATIHIPMIFLKPEHVGDQSKHEISGSTVSFVPINYWKASYELLLLGRSVMSWVLFWIYKAHQGTGERPEMVSQLSRSLSWLCAISAWKNDLCAKPSALLFRLDGIPTAQRISSGLCSKLRCNKWRTAAASQGGFYILKNLTSRSKSQNYTTLFINRNAAIDSSSKFRMMHGPKNSLNYLDLPGEIRNQIMREVFVIGDCFPLEPIQWQDRFDLTPIRLGAEMNEVYRWRGRSIYIPPDRGLLKASRQTYKEGSLTYRDASMTS